MLPFMDAQVSLVECAERPSKPCGKANVQRSTVPLAKKLEGLGVVQCYIEALLGENFWELHSTKSLINTVRGGVSLPFG